jgi:hypothetical protein
MERLGGDLDAVSGVGSSAATSTWSPKASFAQRGVLGDVGSVWNPWMALAQRRPEVMKEMHGERCSFLPSLSSGACLLWKRFSLRWRSAFFAFALSSQSKLRSMCLVNYKTRRTYSHSPITSYAWFCCYLSIVVKNKYSLGVSNIFSVFKLLSMLIFFNI